jgi:hypothetical protein
MRVEPEVSLINVNEIGVDQGRRGEPAFAMTNTLNIRRQKGTLNI